MGCGASTRTSVIEIPHTRVQRNNFSSLDQAQQPQQAAAHLSPGDSMKAGGHTGIVPSAKGASSGDQGRRKTRLSTREALLRYSRMQKVQHAANCYRFEKHNAAMDARAEGEAAYGTCPLHKISKEPQIGNNPFLCVRSSCRLETI
eukprot:TRINITY_DN8424_c1_g1_i2.p1 TRINITY_DN8424_c1_g1~~TRINITY_DN8424_c1_g1_i2.p1  ORF type:complete len:146 (+),score=23.70 TRINITY_DN8424_c1_g1_i2:215-652(+)